MWPRLTKLQAIPLWALPVGFFVRQIFTAPYVKTNRHSMIFSSINLSSGTACGATVITAAASSVAAAADDDDNDDNGNDDGHDFADDGADCCVASAACASCCLLKMMAPTLLLAIHWRWDRCLGTHHLCRDELLQGMNVGSCVKQCKGLRSSPDLRVGTCHPSCDALLRGVSMGSCVEQRKA